MTAVLLRAGSLLAVYLLVLTSVHPADVALGGVIALALAFQLRPRDDGDHPPAAHPRRVVGAVRTLVDTVVTAVKGSVAVARMCLGARAEPGLVELPRSGRSRVEVALWGITTAISPDEVVVDVDEERDVLVVHLVDASDPEAVRARHRDAHERRHGRVLP